MAGHYRLHTPATSPAAHTHAQRFGHMAHVTPPCCLAEDPGGSYKVQAFRVKAHLLGWHAGLSNLTTAPPPNCPGPGPKDHPNSKLGFSSGFLAWVTRSYFPSSDLLLLILQNPLQPSPQLGSPHRPSQTSLGPLTSAFSFIFAPISLSQQPKSLEDTAHA